MEIERIDCLKISKQVGYSWGGNQDWYRDSWQRRSGCGPTTCAALIWYLAGRRPEHQKLHNRRQATKEELLLLMEEVWNYVTPTRMGVHQTSILAEGARRYAEAKGIRMRAEVLDISPKFKKRPLVNAVLEFVEKAIRRDLPVAFLNLSNGELRNLENWHWVLLAAVDREKGTALMLDQGRQQEIELGRWVETTRLGGGFVVLDPE